MPSRSHPAVRRLLSIALLAACSLQTSACYTYHVYQVGGPRELANQPGTEWRFKTLHSLAWGAVRQDIPVDNCQLGSGQRFGIEEIRADTNMAYLLGSVLTLGFWVPLKVGWRCAKPPVTTETLR